MVQILMFFLSSSTKSKAILNMVLVRQLKIYLERDRVRAPALLAALCGFQSPQGQEIPKWIARNQKKLSPCLLKLEQIASDF
jgi:hypothetical protein